MYISLNFNKLIISKLSCYFYIARQRKHKTKKNIILKAAQSSQ